MREWLLVGMKPDGFNIGVNDGTAAGQTVEHAYVHVVPLWNGYQAFAGSSDPVPNQQGAGWSLKGLFSSRLQIRPDCSAATKPEVQSSRYLYSFNTSAVIVAASFVPNTPAHFPMFLTKWCSVTSSF